MVEGYPRIIFGHLRDDPAPQPARRHDVRLLHAVSPACQLPDDKYVDAIDDLALEGRGADERRYGGHGSQVGEGPETLPEPQQPGFRAHGSIVEVGVPDRAEQDRVGGAGRFESPCGDGLAFLADGRAAYPAFFVAHFDAEVVRRCIDDLTRGSDHLGSDAVAREEQYVERISHSGSSWNSGLDSSHSLPP